MNQKIMITAAVGISAIALWFFSPVAKERRILTADSVIKILQELKARARLYSVKIAQFADKIKINSMDPPTKDQLKDMLVHDFSINSIMKSENQPIFDKWEISEEELHSFIDDQLESNQEVKDLMNSINEIIENACLGFVLNEANSLPLALNSQTLSEILSEVFHCELFMVKTKIDMTRNNIEELEDWEIDAFIFNQIRECKAKVFMKFGYGIDEREVNDVIRQGISNFSIVDEKFKSYYKGLEEMYNLHLEKIASRREDKAFEDYIEKKFIHYTSIS